jgi:5-methylcytosine-specific restriction endonuclease McrA
MALLHQHDYGCISCGKNGRGNLTLDHIISLKEGGTQVIENLQPMCISCHSTKDGWKARPLYVRLWEKVTDKIRWTTKKLVKRIKSVNFPF